MRVKVLYRQIESNWYIHGKSTQKDNALIKLFQVNVLLVQQLLIMMATYKEPLVVQPIVHLRQVRLPQEQVMRVIILLCIILA